MKLTRLAVAISLMAAAGMAHATDGYFSDAYGMKAAGMGGAATAMTDDAMGGANNPASMAFVGNRLDLGLTIFSPRRSASRSGLGTGMDGSVDSNSNYFPVPELGYNHMVQPNLALGVTVYGNGGMNTNYQQDSFNCGQGAANMLCGNGKLGVNLMQLIVAPTLAYKLNATNSIGIAPLLGYQRFEAYGLQAFTQNNISQSPNNVTNKGWDDSTGVGVRIGYLGQLTPTFSIGVSYATKMRMTKFGKYSGLFADGGLFDIPENYSVGFAWKATPGLTLAADYQRINYGGVSSIGNPSTNHAQLGAAGGPGFGWKDINVWKLGGEYRYDKQWTFRAGYNHCDNPIQSRDVTFNILAPGVIEDHLTLGATYTMPSGGELTLAYMHAFQNSVSGASILPVFSGGSPSGTETIKMYENSIGISYGWKM